MNEEIPLNYYKGQLDSFGGLRYRLDGDEVIEQAMDTLKGGVVGKVNGKKKYDDQYRCMNDLGIQRARMMILAGVNKINHLTKYKDEERIFTQVKALAKAWLFEVTLNMKVWAPKAKHVNGRLVNPGMDKIRNKRLVVQTVENAILQSSLRGADGFEAGLTAKSWGVTEIMDNRQQEQKRGLLGGFFGGRQRGGNDYG